MSRLPSRETYTIVYGRDHWGAVYELTFYMSHIEGMRLQRKVDAMTPEERGRLYHKTLRESITGISTSSNAVT